MIMQQLIFLIVGLFFLVLLLLISRKVRESNNFDKDDYLRNMYLLLGGILIFGTPYISLYLNTISYKISGNYSFGIVFILMFLTSMWNNFKIDKGNFKKQFEVFFLTFEITLTIIIMISLVRIVIGLVN